MLPTLHSARILTFMAIFALGACASGASKVDTYTGHSGETTVIQSNREMCVSSCNGEYGRCMETDSARDNSGVNGPSGMFGAGADCRNSLKDCLSRCKGG